MSWFKDTVEDWDMVGKALKRSLDRVPTRVTDTEADADEEQDLREVDLNALRIQELREQNTNKRQAEQAVKMIAGD